MHSKYARYAAAVAWVLTIVAAGTLLRVDSFTNWGMLTVLAAGPSLFLMRWQMEPAQTMSESIQQALR